MSPSPQPKHKDLGASSAKKAKQATSKSDVRKAVRKLGHDEKSIEESNDILLEQFTGSSTDVAELPAIVRNELVGEEVPNVDDDSLPDERGNVKCLCLVRDCVMHRLLFPTLQEYLQHHNDSHPGKLISKERSIKLGIYNCMRCKIVYENSQLCVHKADTTNPLDKWFPKQDWSITVAAIKTDVPRVILELFETFMTTVKCTLGIACLERGDKERNLHLQGAAQFPWNPEDTKGLTNLLRQCLKLADYADISFKVQCKIFERGQAWLGMIGYCQKWRDNIEYASVHRGITPADLEKGRIYLQVYRSDYTKDKFIVDQNNIMKASYAHWTATRKPAFVTFEENFTDMLMSGDFVISGKLLCSHPLDLCRTNESWKTLLMPYSTTREQVKKILYGAGGVPSKTGKFVPSRYTLDDFRPSVEDADLIPSLQHHLIRRRENCVVVGPAGCGKSSVIHALTAPHGVRFCGTADELKDVSEADQFIVFDDFDFSDFSVDDVKRVLDREFPTQRVKVRYNDAVLTNKMTRIVLCNELPEQFHDAAVKDRSFVLSSVFFYSI